MAETVPDSEVESAERQRAVPGLLVIFSEGKPRYHPIVSKRGQPLLPGREGFGGLTLGDPKMSTRHAEQTSSGGFEVRALGSRNGTFLDGEREDSAKARPARRAAHGRDRGVAARRDVSRFTRGEVTTGEGMVSGPSLRGVHRKRGLKIEMVRKLFDELHIPMEVLLPREV